MKRTSVAFVFSLLAGLMLTTATVYHDGPYVSYRNDQVFLYYISEDSNVRRVKVDSMPIADRKNISLQVNTDESGKTFAVSLKTELVNEPAEFPAPPKTLVISDIEGNFAAFRKLLQANGVIDNDFNWTFGNGHLVLGGDFVDRGHQVTEVLWLIYSLEEKAKAAGGYVHYILGNHEIMIMSGDIRYVNGKYLETASLIGRSYEGIFDDQSELGRWLRTKNIVEKIGNDIFLHAGISNEMNKLRLSVSSINNTARTFYADSTYQYPDKKTSVIYSDNGPFWYRGYYVADSLNNTDQQDIIDKTTSRWRAKHIFTGHTIVTDTVSVWHKGKVINTDVHHAGGRSEGVLIENGQYFRVAANGEKFLLTVNGQ